MIRFRRSFVHAGVWVAFSVVFGGCASAPNSHSSRRPAGWGRAAADETDIERLRSAIDANRAKVVEFAFLKRWAEARGYRAWVAGGSAAGFAHYVKADLERARKPGRYLDSRFGYKYFQIFRSTQDADVIIDAGEAEAAALEKALKENFDYLQGSKSAWEVRLLRQPRGSGAGLKEPLIDNPNFRNQHSDSHSTGMVELTDPPRGESVVRDLFAWEEHRMPPFLRDVSEGKLHYYWNALHATTSRARAGLNPEILSVIRYFTKSFQYGLEIREEDLPGIQRIIAAFDPSDPALATARGQIENNAQKLYGHAEDLERAYRTLERFGLRRKLIAFGSASTPGKSGGLLDRVPLLSKGLATQGRRASEIFGAEKPIVVSHETKDLLAYESITRSRRGLPNVLISRAGGAGEVAAHGDGFYTRVGREGARGTGLTIRFELHPDAREGHDFAYVEPEGYVVVENRRAIRVIDESVEMNPLDFFRFVSEAKFTPSDLGLWKMLGMVTQSDLSALSPTELEEILDRAIAAMEKEVHPTWISHFVLPNRSLRGALQRRLLAMPPEERGAYGRRFWTLSDPGAKEDLIDGAGVKAWQAFLRDSDAFVTSGSEIGPTIERILAMPAGEGAFRLPPLLPNECPSADSSLKHLLRYAEIIEGPETLHARLRGFGFEEKAKLLILINQALSPGGDRHRTSPHHHYYEWIRDAFLADPARPADFHTRWSLGELASGLFEARLRVGPITEKEIGTLIERGRRSPGDLYPIENALRETFIGPDAAARRSAATIALRLAKAGETESLFYQPTFLRMLVDHPEGIRDASDLAEETRRMTLAFVDRIIEEHSKPGYFMMKEALEDFLIAAFANPKSFDEGRWLKLVEAVRDGGTAWKVGAGMWKRIVGGALVAGHGINPYFRHRADWLPFCLMQGNFQFRNPGLPPEIAAGRLRAFVAEYRDALGVQVKTGALKQGELYKYWQEGCSGLLAK